MEEENNTQKIGFFKTIGYSIAKFEKYPQLAAKGIGKAIIYFLVLVLVLSIVYTASYVYYIANIREYDEENLTLSEKVVDTLLAGYDDEELTEEFTEAAELLSEYSENYIIGSLFISFFIAFVISILCDVLILSIFGMITSWIAKLEMNYKTMFCMSIYAMTLALILRMIYSAITLLTTYTITYFNIVYIGVSYITLAAAIFLIGSDVNKIKQSMMIGRIEDSLKNSEEELENLLNKKPKDENEDEEENDKESKDKKEEDKNEDEQHEEKQTDGQGSNA